MVQSEKKTVAKEIWFTKSTRNIQNEEKQYITIGGKFECKRRKKLSRENLELGTLRGLWLCRGR
jgi:hypothetical protein